MHTKLYFCHKKITYKRLVIYSQDLFIMEQGRNEGQELEIEQIEESTA